MLGHVFADADDHMNSSVLVPALGTLVADSKNHDDCAILDADAAIEHLDHGAKEFGPASSSENRDTTISRTIPEIVPDELDGADFEIQSEFSLIGNGHISGVTITEGIPGNASLVHHGNQVNSTEENMHQKNDQKYSSDVQVSVEHGLAEAHDHRSACNSVSQDIHSDREESLIESTERESVAHEESSSREFCASQRQVLDVTVNGVDGAQAEEVIIQTNMVDAAMTSNEFQEIKANKRTFLQTTAEPWMHTERDGTEVKVKTHASVYDVSTNGNDEINIEIVKKDFETTPVQGQCEDDIKVVTFDAQEVREADFAEKKGIFTGRTIRKRFGKKYFLGMIDSYDREYNWYKVLYEDGDQEDLAETELVALLLPEDYLTGVSIEKRRLLEGSVNGRNSKKYKREVDNTSKTDFGTTQSIGCSGGEGSSSETSEARMVLGNESLVDGRKEETDDSKRPWTGIRRYLEKQETHGQSSIDKGLNQKIIAKEDRALKRCVHKIVSGENPTSICDHEDEGATDALVGALVCKRFSGRYYNGNVVNYDKETKYYLVEYEDGDREELELHELKPILILSLTPTTKKSSKMADVQERTDLIGAVVRKRIGKTYSIGDVVSFNEHTKMYKIKYEDGHEEDLERSRLEKMLVKKLKYPMEKIVNDSADDDRDNSMKMDARVTKYGNKEITIVDNSKTMAQNGGSLIGSRTLKKFGRKVYAGSVINYDKKRKLYKVKYEDGDQEELQWSELEPTLVQQQQQSSADLYGEYVFNELDCGGKSKTKRSVQTESRDISESEAITQKDELKMGRNLIGSSTRKKFGRKFYAGSVIDYDKKSKFYRVRYEDGDEEDLDWSELEPTLEKQIKTNNDEDKGGATLIGRSIKKKFSGKLYNGRIISYDNETKFFKVKYEDDDQEDLDWDELQHVLTE